jgi:hypothetical protein
MKSEIAAAGNSLRRLVGAWRFELQTSCAQGRRATRLRYAPTCECIVDSKVGLDIRSSYIHRAGAVSRTNCTRHDEMTPVLSFYVVARSTQGAEKWEGLKHPPLRANRCKLCG